MSTLPITEPGIYADIPMDAYHGQLTDTPSISSSGLRTILSKSPAHYYAESYLNPEAERVDTTALRFGKAAHSLLLGEEVFSEHFEVAPFVLGRNVNETSDGKKPAKGETPEWTAGDKTAWWQGVQEAGRLPLTQDEFASLRGMEKALKAEPLIQDGLLDGEAERSIVVRDEETGVWLKARPDVLPKAGWMVDYKTIADAHERKVARSVWDYGYHMQLALAAECLAMLGYPVPTKYALVFQEKKAPFAVTIQEIPVEAIWAGAKQNRTAIRRFAQCLADDTWPGYGIAPTLTTPQFIIDQCAGIPTADWMKPLENA